MTTTSVVTVICSVGVGVAVLILVTGWNGTAPPRSVPAVTLSPGATVREVARIGAATLTAGLVGVILGFGLGSRLMMRTLAATSPDARGRLTDADEIVGEVSTGGTVFLVGFLALFSAMAAVIYQLLRCRLPQRSVPAGLVAAGIGGGLLARPSGLLDPDNRDFVILGPQWLAVLACAAVVVVGSLTIAVLVDRWTAVWPEPAWSPRGVAGVIPLAVCVMPFVGVVVLSLVLAQLLGPRLAARRRRAGPKRRPWVLPAAGAVGAVWTGISAAQILA
jgi:tryptophan-rich sensory protein